MSLGLAAAGFDVRLGFDREESAVTTYNNNLYGHGRVADAWQADGRGLLAAAGLDSVDLFSGGPPCQGFSKQRRGAHLLEDPRNGLVLEYARLIGEAAPKAFLFENVEIVGQKRGRDLIAELADRLCGYDIHQFLVNSADFGLAQARGRFVMIGLRSDLAAPAPFLVKAAARATVRDAIGDLPPPPDDCSEHKKFANHIKCRISEANVARIKHVPQGGGWKDIPYDLRLPCHKAVDGAKGGWPDVYGRLAWDGQCPTITAGFDSFTRGRYGHPEQHRALTLREGARLQGFPDAFRFTGNRDAVRRQIGNAVPPPLAKAAGEAILRCMAGVAGDGFDRVQTPDFSTVRQRVVPQPSTLQTNGLAACGFLTTPSAPA
jgi:DNA (cytosine-5)-methyltransferase 1